MSDIPPAQLTGVTTSGCLEDPSGTPTCSLGTIASGGTGIVFYGLELRNDTSRSFSGFDLT